MTIKQKLDNFKALDLIKLGGEALEATKADYLAYNVDQLKKGKNKDGTQIGTYSTSKMGRDYALYKHEKNPTAGLGNVDLINTGDMSEMLDFKLHNRLIETFSHDQKYNLLVGMYGNKFVGMPDEKLDTYRKNDFYPDFMPRVKSRLNA